MPTPTPMCLIILDGFGHRAEHTDNAIAQAHKPNWDALLANYPHSLINASEQYVGLPSGQMGNSEVGHLNIGTGRMLTQDLERVSMSIANGEFFKHPALCLALQQLKNNQHALHIAGLLSDGGIHSHQQHIHAMLQLAAAQGLSKVYVHLFLDGRDTPPVSAAGYISALETEISTLGVGKIASLGGRFYGMDRDKRWARVEVAYQLLCDGQSPFVYPSAEAALAAAYARGENDEFVTPTAIRATHEMPLRIEDGDVMVMMNFRADRMRQISHAFLDTDFTAFVRLRMPKLAKYFTLTHYDDTLQDATVLLAPQIIHNGLGEYLASLNLKQLRIAETEKYPHVTFFFNGGRETPFAGEDRIMVPSPKVKTYDLQPEMSAFEVTTKLEKAIASRQYALIVCNYANSDMVGHTGNLTATTRAVETLDICIGRVVNAMQKIGGEVLITADHGNAETMYDAINHQPHTQHTTNLVPLLYVGRKATLLDNGALSDLAPTLLHLMGLPQPIEMTGRNLVLFENGAL